MANKIVKMLEAEWATGTAEKPTIKVPQFMSGDTVVVQIKVKEGERTRVQSFEGVVIAKRNRGYNSAFTVRKISHGVGVERVFQTFSPIIESIEVKRRGEVRRAKLYYMRELSGKAARIREKLPTKLSAQDKEAASAKKADAVVADAPKKDDSESKE